MDNNDFVNYMSAFISNFVMDVENDEFYTSNDKWDLLKISIRDKCMAFVRNAKFNETESITLENDIKFLSSKLASNPNDDILIKQLLSLTLKREFFELAQSRGALKRSRASFVEENEKSSAFFLGLEKTSQSQKTIKEVYDEDNSLIDAPCQIVGVLSDFYKNLMNTSSADLENHGLEKTVNNLNTFLQENCHAE